MIGEALVALYDSCEMCSHVENTMLSTEEGGPLPLVLQRLRLIADATTL